MIISILLTISFIGLYVYTYHSTFSSERICINYKCVITNGELWRTFTGPFFHTDIVHVLYDVVIIQSLSSTMERDIGSLQFLKSSFLIMLLTTMLQMLVYHIVATVVSPTLVHVNTNTMGFSSILLGLLTAHAHHASTFEFVLFPGLAVAAANAPLLAYLLASCLLTEASVLGHFCGGLSGWMLGAGGLEWVSGYWLSCVVLWCIGGVIASMKTTTFVGSHMRFVHCEMWPPWKLDGSMLTDNLIDDQLFVVRVASERVTSERVLQQASQEQQGAETTEEEKETGEMVKNERHQSMRSSIVVNKETKEEKLEGSERKNGNEFDFDFDDDDESMAEQTRLLGSP